MKKSILVLMLLFTVTGLVAQSKEEAAVRNVMAIYKRAMENLDSSGTIPKLFTKDAIIYENGDPGDKVDDFVKGHMYPEFKMFHSFTYKNHKLNVIVSGNYAFTTETYDYTIVLKKDMKPIVPNSMGVATAVLTKTKDGWKIISYHSSYRKRKATN